MRYSRYSKPKVIATAIFSVLCVFAVVFLIVKGINDSKKISENDTSSKLVASVSNKKEVEKRKKEESSKKTLKKTTKKEETKKEEKEEKVIVVTKKNNYDGSMYGTYTVKELKKGDKTYTQDEIENLKNDGYSMELVITKKGMATVSVMELERTYAVTDSYFEAGDNKIEYSKNIDKIKIKIDEYEILFVKE